jgi:ferric-dicitrate binding protein FerR (iron transport regulator)
MDKELLIRYIKGECNDQEKIIVVNWLESDPANMKEYLGLRKLYDITLWNTPVDELEGTRQPKSRKIYIEILKIAAVLFIGVLITKFFLVKGVPEESVTMQKIFVPAGQRAEITLADGTHVWLNAQTTLLFPTQFKGDIRQVKLDGEAFFDVTSDKSHPFIVTTSKYHVRVWGTKFNLIAYSKSDVFETSLFEGAVEVLKPNEIKGRFIYPNERMYLSENSLVKEPIIHYNHFLWKEGIISFDNESFSEMAQKLELYFDLKIEIKNDNILKYYCTGKFRTKDGVEHILKVLQLSNKFKYAINDQRNTVLIE